MPKEKQQPPETSDPRGFESALLASQKVFVTIQSLTLERDAIQAEIEDREQELVLHQKAALPESSLVDFFIDYVDAASEKGGKMFQAHLETVIYPERYGSPEPLNIRQPISFEEVTAVLNGESSGVLGWLVENVANPLPRMNSSGEVNSSLVLTFLFQDQIKAAITRLFGESGFTYRTPVLNALSAQQRAAFSVTPRGLPLVERRERIATLNEEIATLKKEKAGVDSKIATLKGGVAC